MSLQTGMNRLDRRAVVYGLAGVSIVAGLITGFGSPTALADPATPTTTEADTPSTPTMTADQALAIIQSDYDIGAGGGQLSNLIHEVLTLRAQGFTASNANRVAIEEALDKRPNQAPLIAALQETLAYQRKMQAIQQRSNNGQQQPGYGFGVGQPPPGMGSPVPPGVPVDPGANPGVGIFLPPG